MKEYPLQYASTDKNKKSHYNYYTGTGHCPSTGHPYIEATHHERNNSKEERFPLWLPSTTLCVWMCCSDHYSKGDSHTTRIDIHCDETFNTGNSESCLCNSIVMIVYAMKVMTSFCYEIMLTRGCWFQTLDVNKPWRQIPADRLLFLVFTHFFFSDYPKAIRRGEISFKSNHVIERNFEAANSRVTGTSSGQL